MLDWLNGDVGQLRADYERQRALPMPTDARWLAIRAVRVLEHRVPRQRDAAIVYFHGGGFIVGSPLTHADVTTELCRRTGLPLYSVDYRLAPEFVAPAPADDGRAVVGHLVADGMERVILCGDSAGGTIALAVAASLPTGSQRFVAGVCSFYGACDRTGREGLDGGSRADGTDAACMKRYFDLATGGAADSPYAAGALCKPSSIPVYLMAGSRDPLRDDTVHLVQALEAAGRQVTASCAQGEGHGFLHEVERSRAASEALDHAARWIRERCRKV